MLRNPILVDFIDTGKREFAFPVDEYGYAQRPPAEGETCPCSWMLCAL
jgi:hypothetical protein